MIEYFKQLKQSISSFYLSIALGLMALIILTAMTTSLNSDNHDNLESTCSLAKQHLDILSSYATGASADDYADQIKHIHDYWDKRVNNDPCSIGNCNTDSPELKTSQIITDLSSLSARLIVRSCYGVPQNLKLTVDATSRLIESTCNVV